MVFLGRAGTGNEATQRPLRTHRLALFLLLPLLLFLFLPLHITRHTLSCSLSLSLSFFLSISLSFSLLRSTAFIIKIKCKIVPRTSFPNGIKLRAVLSFPTLSLYSWKVRSFVPIVLFLFILSYRLVRMNKPSLILFRFFLSLYSKVFCGEATRDLQIRLQTRALRI